MPPSGGVDATLSVMAVFAKGKIEGYVGPTELGAADHLEQHQRERQRDPGQQEVAGQDAGREDATDRIWRLLTLQLWGGIFLTGKRDECWDGVMAAARPVV